MFKKKVALFIEVGNVFGGGGAERQFISFFLLNKSSAFDYFLLMSDASFSNAKKVGLINNKKKVIIFKNFNNRFAKYFSFIQIILKCKLNQISIIHIANFDNYYAELFLALASYFKITLNINDCRFYYEVSSSKYQTLKEFLNKQKLSGIYSWYRNVCDLQLIKDLKIHVASANYCFVDNSKFRPLPQKENIVVFASRLDEQKRPEIYLEVVKCALNWRPQLVLKWEFYLLGDGELKQKISQAISDLRLNDLIKLNAMSDISPILNKSKIFISTQKYENFTSLSMLEAMSSGNAILSFNVGQTSFFVEDGVNGYLVPDNDVTLMAEKLIQLMENTNLNCFGVNSNTKATRIHNIENFEKDFDQFFSFIN